MRWPVKARSMKHAAAKADIWTQATPLSIELDPDPLTTGDFDELEELLRDQTNQ